MIRREDGSWLYMLPSVVDDIDMGVTHVVRGEDHVTNTGLQLQMFEALGAAPPAFAHEALLVGSEGKLSKRLGSLGVEAMREAGIEPIALIAKLARIGTSLPVEPVADARAADRALRFRHLRPRSGPLRHGRAGGAQRPDRPPARLRRRCGRGCPPAWRRRTGRRSGPICKTVAEAADWWEILHGHVEQAARGGGPRLPRRRRRGRRRDRLDRIALAAARRRGSRSGSGRAGKALFQPLRRALTGRDSGPEMAALLPLIGRDEAVARLAAAAN